jgi:hypothetical protein
MAQREDIETVFTLAGWEEKPYVEAEGVKLTKARFEKEYRGDVAGRSVSEMLMVYRPDGTAKFVGFERFEGTVRGRTGTFVIQGEGTFQAGVADSRGVVVEGAGTGELRGLSGEAIYKSSHAEEYPMVFRLSFG